VFSTGLKIILLSPGCLSLLFISALLVVACVRSFFAEQLQVGQPFHRRRSAFFFTAGPCIHRLLALAPFGKTFFQVLTVRKGLFGLRGTSFEFFLFLPFRSIEARIVLRCHRVRLVSDIDTVSTFLGPFTLPLLHPPLSGFTSSRSLVPLAIGAQWAGLNIPLPGGFQS